MKCMECEVEGPRPRGRPKRTWRDAADCQACNLIKEDTIDHRRRRKLIMDVWWRGWVWVGKCFFWYWPTRVVLDKGPLNGCVWVLLTLWLAECRSVVKISSWTCLKSSSMNSRSSASCRTSTPQTPRSRNDSGRLPRLLQSALCRFCKLVSVVNGD